ncbi:hypothetical protein HDU87_000596 [Geranomyces variabilis]|uniref:AB hydrolase-1 domain-containing protein n=1 Tax=Geranomyces variabilis TaxID=109894 RepID=A0AAD5TBU6_9FUNG|nr:hypothetical protein HDU87_000596 [Geranomyces variabilis]
MPIGHSPRKYWALRTVVLLVDLLTPLCCLYTLSHALHPVVTSRPLAAYCLVETLFLAFTTWKRHEFQATVKEGVYPMLRSEERLYLFNLLMKEVSRFPAFLTSQFMWADTHAQLTAKDVSELRMDNVREFMAWFLFAQKSFEEIRPELAAEADSMLKHAFCAHGLAPLQEGYNPKIKATTLTHNKVEAYHKPLAMYAIIAALEKTSHLPLRVLGFRRWRAKSPATGLTYWLRYPKRATRHRRDDKDLPLVFIHGLGGGLWCYVKFIAKLWYTQRERPIYLVELPHVSMRFTKDSPDPDASVRSIAKMLADHGHGAAVFVGHSLGTAYLSYINKHTTLAVGNVFLDPVVFRIYDTSLLYNFVHRRPGAGGTEKKANHLLMHWLVARELWISHWISRHFIWHRIHLPADRLPAAHTHVVIPERDNLINDAGGSIVKYLRGHGIATTVHAGADHAQFIIDEALENDIVEKIGAVLRSAGREWSRKRGPHAANLFSPATTASTTTAMAMAKAARPRRVHAAASG